MRIKLIAPHERTEDLASSADTFKIRKVGLPLLAALTPPGHDVTLVDEAFAPDDVDGSVDLVGISVMTELARRAYRIAETYRRRGVRVVMGGIHPTVLPSEVLKHADAVVVGEAEEAWPRLVADAASGRMQPIYRAGRGAALRGMPRPRRELYPSPEDKGHTPLATGVETARGCPYDCEFCSVGSVLGRGYRVRPVREVIAEIESLDSRNLFFVDDALGLDRRQAKKLFAEMIPLRCKWVGQGTVSLAEDLNLLRLMKLSGCLGMLVGFESAQAGPRGAMKKIDRLTIDFREAVRRFHDHGIAILGAFVFGFDHEDRDVFDRTLDFVMESRVDFVQLRILLPFPGTRLHGRLLAEGRLVEPEWWLRGAPPDTLLYRPRGMTVEQFLDGFERLNRQVYSLGGMTRRFFGMSPWRRTSMGCSIYFGFNLATRRRYLQSLGIPQPLRDPASMTSEGRADIPIWDSSGGVAPP